MSGSLRSYLLHEFVWMLVCATSMFSQAVPTATLKGTVSDDSTSTVLENADVFLSQTTLGSATDKHGQFEIKNVPIGSYELIVSRLGYQMRSMRVVVSQSSPEDLKVTLQPKLIAMNEVAVAATEPKEWKAQLEKFNKLFFGESELAGEAKLLNPEVLDFTGNAKPDFEATARMPLEIENLALGYHLQFILTRFVLNKTSPGSGGQFNRQQYLNCVGQERFIELTPTSVEEGARWKMNRRQAYKGSVRHFLVSLFRCALAKEGFVIGLIPEQSSNRWSTGFVESIGEKDILSDGSAPYEKILHFAGTLLVKYVGKPIEAQKQLLDAVNPSVDVSRVRLNYESVRINSQGVIKDWAPTRLYGYWAASRIADALPLDYKPDESALVFNDFNPDASPATSTQIVPLAVGNQWTTQRSEWDTEVHLTSPQVESSHIVGDTIIAGERWFIMSRSHGKVICMNGPDGYYELRSGAKTLRLKYPANVGDSYQGLDGDVKVVSVAAKITVPKGSFVCYLYEFSLSRMGGFKAKSFYSPGVGFVAGEIVTANTGLTGGSVIGKVELIDYTLH